MSGRPEGTRPMKPANFHILLVLAEKSSHGLGIAKAVDIMTGGAMTLGPGTLYRALQELMIEEASVEVDSPDGETDPRRRFYEITPAGLDRARSEAERLANLVRVAERNAVLPEAR